MHYNNKKEATKTHFPSSANSDKNSQSIQFKNNRPEATRQLKVQEMANSTVQRKKNKTGMPDQLKSGIENLSGMDMSDVKVHYNSSQPAQLQAHAYAQGNQIHLASGQEKHLPHEAWHVVQQKQGRVSPTTQLKGKVNINDNAGLEKEADVMGAKAQGYSEKLFTESKTVDSKPLLVENFASRTPQLAKLPCGHISAGVIQRMITEKPDKDIKTIDQLLRYTHGTFINNRFQTFEQAVQEAIDNAPKGASPDLKRMYEAVNSSINEDNINRALFNINNIIEEINKREAIHPNHPNAVWGGKKQREEATHSESPFTIPKTSKSNGIAKEMQKLILHSPNLNEDEKCMLGVLVLPNGKLIVGLSGAGQKFSDKVLIILQKQFPLFEGKIYTIKDIHAKDSQTYTNDVESQLPTKDKFKKDTNFFTDDPKTGDTIRNKNHNKVVRKKGDGEEQGSFESNCAASVVISVAKQKAADAFFGKEKLGLTELWIAKNSNSKVIVYNLETAEGKNFYNIAEDVPSCHVCQMQLERVAREVVQMERENILIGINEQLVQVEKENKELLSDVKQLEAEISGIILSGEQNEKLKQLVNEQEAFGNKLEEANKELVKNEEKLEKLEKDIKDKATKIKDLSSGLKTDRKNLNKKNEKLVERKTSLDDKEKQQENQVEIAKLMEQLKELNRGKESLKKAVSTKDWGFGPFLWAGKSLETVKSEIQKGLKEDKVHGDLFQEGGKKKNRKSLPFEEQVESIIGNKQLRLDSLEDEEKIYNQLNAEVDRLKNQVANDEETEKSENKVLAVLQSDKDKKSESNSLLKKEVDTMDAELKKIDAEILKLKAKIDDKVQSHPEKKIKQVIHGKNREIRDLKGIIHANDIRVSALRKSAKTTALAVQRIEHYYDDTSSISIHNGSGASDMKSNASTILSSQLPAKGKKSDEEVKDGKIAQIREQLASLAKELHEKNQQEKPKEGIKSEEKDQDAQAPDMALWHNDEIGDVALNPNSFPLFRAAYLRDVVESSAFLTEAEGSTLANHLNISLNVMEGEINLDEYHVITNRGGGDCLIHTLAAAQHILQGGGGINPLTLNSYNAGNVRADRKAIAENMNPDQLKAVIAATVFGHEPGLGPNMRSLVHLAELTKDDFSKKDDPQKESSKSEKKEQPQNEESAIELPQLGHGGQNNPILFAHHYGIHWQLIVKKNKKK